jgi:hypothetical protein
VDPQAPEHADPELDALLRSHRPMPDAAWVATTERRLLPTRRRLSWRRAPALRLGVALAVALAGLVLALSLVGGGPLAGDGTVDARDDCRTVAVMRTERVPVVVDGGSRIEYRSERVRRLERRCR